MNSIILSNEQTTEMATNIPINEPTNEFALFDRVATDITNTFELLIVQLTARRDALLRELQVMKENYITKETTRKSALEELIQQIGLLSLKVNENRDFQQLTTDLFRQRIEHLETPTQLPLPSFSSPTLSHLQTQIAEFGEIEECKVELDYSLKKLPVLAVGKEGKANNGLYWPRGLALDEPNKLIYIADRYNSRIQVVSLTGKFLKRFGQGILKSPWGIAVTEDNVFVTDWDHHALFQFSKKDYQLERRTGTRGEGQLNHPSGLCTDTNGDVYVADSDNHRVSVFSKELNYLKHLGTQQLRYPYDVKVTPNSVVVLDWSPNCIHFFSRSGDLIRSCVTRGEDDMVSDPWFFCMDAAGNILITDRNRHSIKILSTSGQLMHEIGKHGHGRGEFSDLTGICLSKTGTIFVVSDNYTFGLQSF